MNMLSLLVLGVCAPAGTQPREQEACQSMLEYFYYNFNMLIFYPSGSENLNTNFR